MVNDRLPNLDVYLRTGAWLTIPLPDGDTYAADKGGVSSDLSDILSGRRCEQ